MSLIVSKTSILSISTNVGIVLLEIFPHPFNDNDFTKENNLLNKLLFAKNDETASCRINRNSRGITWLSSSSCNFSHFIWSSWYSWEWCKISCKLLLQEQEKNIRISNRVGVSNYLLSRCYKNHCFFIPLSFFLLLLHNFLIWSVS